MREVILDPVTGDFNYEVPYERKHDTPLNGMVIEELNGVPSAGGFPRIHLNRNSLIHQLRPELDEQPDIHKSFALEPDVEAYVQRPISVGKKRITTPERKLAPVIKLRSTTPPLITKAKPKRSIDTRKVDSNVIGHGGPGGMEAAQSAPAVIKTNHAVSIEQPSVQVADSGSATAPVELPEKKTKAGGIIAAVVGAIVLYGIFSSEDAVKAPERKKDSKPKGLGNTKNRAPKKTNSKPTRKASKKKTIVTGAI